MWATWSLEPNLITHKEVWGGREGGRGALPVADFLWGPQDTFHRWTKAAHHTNLIFIEQRARAVTHRHGNGGRSIGWGAGTEYLQHCFIRVIMLTSAVISLMSPSALTGSEVVPHDWRIFVSKVQNFCRTLWGWPHHLSLSAPPKPPLTLFVVSRPCFVAWSDALISWVPGEVMFVSRSHYYKGSSSCSSSFPFSGIFLLGH